MTTEREDEAAKNAELARINADLSYWQHIFEPLGYLVVGWTDRNTVQVRKGLTYISLDKDQVAVVKAALSADAGEAEKRDDLGDLAMQIWRGLSCIDDPCKSLPGCGCVDHIVSCLQDREVATFRRAQPQQQTGEVIDEAGLAKMSLEADKTMERLREKLPHPTGDAEGLSADATAKIENIRRQAKAWSEIASDEEAAPTGSMLAAVNSLLVFLDKCAAIIDRLNSRLAAQAQEWRPSSIREAQDMIGKCNLYLQINVLGDPAKCISGAALSTGAGEEKP